ncbi:uncharacterized protein [Gossypium hirsutum]|uniref:Uncharacterized protein n=1 Tax=Gossypium hirsutum TaxID=3635 RepID=A0ABM3AU06_GOSHI|nr:uncharacterized protein LOC121222023 [Gossypium hirsutum]
MNLTQCDRSVVEYEAEFLRLSHYARDMMASKYEKCVYFEDGLRDNLRVLITPQRECEFSILVDKTKIIDKVKRVERQNRDRERGKNKRDLEHSSSVQRPKKRARPDGQVRVGVHVTSIGIQPYEDCGKHYLGECWRRLGACLRCGSLEHRSRVCPQRADQIQALGLGSRASDRSASQQEARQPTLVYATRRREDIDVPDVITDTFFIFNVPYTAMIDIGSTHSYVASIISENLGISVENTSSEITVLSPLGQSVRVNKLYRNVPLEFIMVSIDDILVYSKTKDEHDEHLKGIRVDPRKIEAILEWKQLKNVSEIYSFWVLRDIIGGLSRGSL